MIPIFAISSIAAIVMALAITLYYNREESKTLEIKEYLVDSNLESARLMAEITHGDGHDEDEILINGIWAKEFVSISINADNLEHSSEIETIARQVINGPISGYNLTGWHIVFHTMLNTAGRSSIHLFMPDEDTNPADIAIEFTNNRSVDNKGRIAGTTTVDTAPDHTISWAQITIYESDFFYERDILVPIVMHELGHALGLGHSTNFNSIMYPNLVTRNGVVGGDIGICELAALNSLYVVHQNVTGYIQCNK